ncbi:UDP-glucuronate 4-epimerase 1, partial [Cucurbita argyrosperma subsp. argyrosperma]
MGRHPMEKQLRHSAQTHRPNGLSVLVTGAAGFVGTHVSLALKNAATALSALIISIPIMTLPLKKSPEIASLRSTESSSFTAIKRR